MSARVALVLFLLTLSGCVGAAPSTPRRDLLVSLGDSVAAGHGLGLARGYPSNPTDAFPHLLGQELGLDVRNLAISGACTGSPGFGHPGAAKNCTISILKDELALLPEEPPRLMTLTVGANDIRFSECLRAFIVNDAHQPCRGALFEERLGVVDANLPLILDEVRTRTRGLPPVLLTLYYNPLPPPSTNPADACDLWGPAAIARNPALATVPHESEAFRRAVLDVQRDGWNLAVEVLGALNGRLQAFASARGVTAVPLDFTGHDICASVRGAPPEATWAYGPDWDDGASAPGAPPRYRSRPMPGACPDTSLDPPETNVIVGASASQPLIGYSLRFKVNCLPHPTPDGHRAIADELRMAQQL